MDLRRSVALLVVCTNFWAVGCHKNQDRGSSAGAGADADKPAIVDDVRLLSANVLYRDFQNNPVDASNKYVGKTVVIEGLLGEVRLHYDDVGAGVHIADSGRPNALILNFPDRNNLAGIDRGQKFRFKCTVNEYKHSIVWLEDCTTERE